MAEERAVELDRSTLPKGVGRWNWGAFLLTWLWALGNSVWFGVLALIPWAGALVMAHRTLWVPESSLFVTLFCLFSLCWLVLAVMLAIKGNQWAWRSRSWKSVKSFRTAQRIWAWSGLVVWLATAGGIYYVIMQIAIGLSMLVGGCSG